MLDGEVVLITGGTGSFGKASVRIILQRYRPRKVIVFSRDELKQYEMAREFGNPGNLRFLLGDVRDKRRLYRAFAHVDIVIHAAALKQVPACEYNPIEAVKTNVDGAINIIDAAIDQGVRKVIALSTDKAVNPINLYGATKLCSDKLFVQGNAYVGSERRTRFAVVRYGNVIGSRGSVIPLFLNMRKTGVLHITDARMSRFWITLQQGVEFVLDCLQRMNGGEIFVPKIPSMNITALAKAVCPECTHEYVGIRPGEKLHEVLIPEDDARRTLEFDDRFIIMPWNSMWPMDEATYKEGTPCPDGFRYSSDTNPQWLSSEDLKALIQADHSE